MTQHGPAVSVRRGRPAGRSRPREGFTVMEVLVAAVIGLGALAILVPLVRHAGEASRALPASVDIDQRTRAAAALIERVIMRAGEGFAAGPYAGPLSAVVPAVFPHRRRVTGADAPLASFADRFSVWRSDGSLARLEFAASMATGFDPISLWWTAPCEATNAACRFAEDDLALVHDRHGRFAALRVVAPTVSTIGHVPADLGTAFDVADAPQVARLRVSTVSYDAANRLVRVGDGEGESPLIDHVATFQVRYFGDPRPPRGPAPPLGEATCLFDAAGNPTLPTLVADSGPWVELVPAMLSDGPVCGAGASAYDADLLRVRRITVRLRLEAADEHLRGVDPARFTNPGRGRSTAVSPDREVLIDVTPRNLLWP